ncbi:DUF2393 family protein [Sulfurimonas sp. MAG313]|nr:DUF2393 family protein [Sulfurimonas sp. MAG313]MDF1880289.1 DUF2393 family protein [Sulfurimonas sp. MAG313]
MNKFKSIFQAFVQTLHMYDYVLFAASGALFLLFLVMGILLRNKIGLSLLLVLFAFISLIAGPILGYHYVHASIYKTKISNLEIKKLEFSQAIVIKGTITNYGKESFKRCKISSSAYKGASNFLQELVYPLKPFLKRSILTEEALDINASTDFKLMLEPFTYSKEYNISVKVDCI